MTLKITSIVVAVLIVVIWFLAATGPNTFSVSRSISIRAPAERIFPLINDLRSFTTWSPYEKKDPAMTRAFSDPESGPGAVYDFAGNSQVGTGRVTITNASPPTQVTMTLDMLTPMKTHNVIEFTLTPDANGTIVTWNMRGPRTFVTKVLNLFIDTDKIVSSDFEAGLASLKAIASGDTNDRQ
ncbi:MAG: SRPBCC family protein [Gammaproteobacteria bacterium]|nr:SRPBCC family protein [Gammaproteobacteria bacterium]